MRYYLDTSAAMKLLVGERESPALASALDSLGDDAVVIASWLLHTELHCAAARRGIATTPRIEAVLDSVVLVDVERSDLTDAPTIGAGLRSQDALHLATALRVDAEQLITYDAEQAEAARRAGMRVLAPGAS